MAAGLFKRCDVEIRFVAVEKINIFYKLVVQKQPKMVQQFQEIAAYKLNLQMENI